MQILVQNIYQIIRYEELAMDFFLQELFDVPNISEIDNLANIFDVGHKSLIYDKIYEHPLILFNLTFIHCWELCFGVTPSKIDIYMAKKYFNANPSLQSSARNILTYVHNSTFHKYISNDHTSTQILEKMCHLELHINRDAHTNVKKCLADKLQKRLHPWLALDRDLVNMKNPRCKSTSGSTPLQFTPTQSLYTYYLELFAAHHHGRDEIKSTYERGNGLIVLHNLTLTNIYTGFTVQSFDNMHKLVTNWPTVNPIEAIGFQMTHDYYFLRTICGKPVFTCFGHDSILSTIARQSMQQLYKGQVLCLTQSPSYTDVMTDDFDRVSGIVQSKHVFDSCVPHIIGHYLTLVSHPERYPHTWNSAKSNANKNTCIFDCRTEQIDFDNVACKKFKSISRFADKDIEKSDPRLLTFGRVPHHVETDDDADADVPPELTRAILDLQLACVTVPEVQRPMHEARILAMDYILQYIYRHKIHTNRSNNKNNKNKSTNDHQTNDGGDNTRRGSKHCLLYVDNRMNMLGVYSILITMYNLKQHLWDVVILTTKNNQAYYKSHIPSSIFVHHNDIEKANFNIDDYNKIMKDQDTWSNLTSYDKCLVVQDDGMLLRKGLEDTFLQYDYVGAPWLKCAANSQLLPFIGDEFVGNGGLSLRTIATMCHICKTFQNEKHVLFNSNLQPIPEDVYFSMCCKKMNAKIATSDEASQFAMEEVYSPLALGIHKFWVYHNSTLVNDFFAKLLA